MVSMEVGDNSKGKAAMAATCTVVTSGDTIKPAENACFLLTFDQAAAETRFTVDATGVSNIAFFGQHVPTEFEEDTHYFLTAAGADVEPGAQKTADGGAVG